MIRFATIGTSKITHQFVDALTQAPGAELVGVYSRSTDKARRASADFGVGLTWTDLGEMLGSSDVDAVYVASPNGIHYEQAGRALEAGKHVLVEKPAVPTAAEFATLLDEAERHGVVIFEGMRNIYDPSVEAIKALLGTIGQIRRVSLSFSQRSSRYDLVLAGKQVNIFDPKLFGGALYDIGVYCVGLLIELFGVPESVSGADVTIGSGADGAGIVVAAYPGMAADLSYSKITASARVSEIQGELGTLTFDSVTSPREIAVSYLDGRSETRTIDLPADNPADNMVFEIERFCDLVAGADPTPDQNRTLRTLQMMDAIRASIIRP
ncbi:Gfo/Idh/MocA family oxidoreductase [Propionimicrobium sp. PCR01-08-3]|uniref:Gfo/Idh/MocA family protein n=1 Tax=Propionimicrobium sp. PCR01-08-3 TaxID=3052086 RepID=UPI00255CA7B6|nr:Gfo/Idh/MocA family oxidoreductase [Propionimicrobium sp. PCR01-08-3]WIY82246.1 Gfo/Idh/MocA family oxidoreductase [Propionimicrobium sp. PCR01-08-3]